MKWFKQSPAFRYGARVVVVAIVSYAVSAWHDGVTDWRSFAKGAVSAAIYAAIGLLTPVEPFVGVQPTNVEVPVPPAVRET